MHSSLRPLHAMLLRSSDENQVALGSQSPYHLPVMIVLKCLTWQAYQKSVTVEKCSFTTPKDTPRWVAISRSLR
jgi:hypothetical protein